MTDWWQSEINEALENGREARRQTENLPENIHFIISNQERLLTLFTQLSARVEQMAAVVQELHDEIKPARMDKKRGLDGDKP